MPSHYNPLTKMMRLMVGINNDKFIYMYLVTCIIIIINFEEDINRSLLELRLDLKYRELELNCLYFFGIGIETYCALWN